MEKQSEISNLWPHEMHLKLQMTYCDVQVGQEHMVLVHEILMQSGHSRLILRTPHASPLDRSTQQVKTSPTTARTSPPSSKRS
eukprot:5629552-Amphidinium_carterae.1